MVVYATWEWRKVVRERSYSRFLKNTLAHYMPWLENNLMMRPAILDLLKPPPPPTLQPPEHLAEVAQHYGFLG